MPLLDSYLDTPIARPSLEAQWETIETLLASNEASFSGVVDAITGFFTDSIDYMKNLFASRSNDAFVAFSANHKLADLVAKTNPAVFSDVQLKQAPGVNVSMGEWIAALHKAQDTVSVLDKQVFSPAIKMLALFVSDPETLAARNPNIALYRIQVPAIAKATEIVAKCKKVGSDINQRGFFDLYRNTQDYGKVETQYVQLQRDFDKTPLIDVKKAVERISEISDKILYKIQDPEDPTVISDNMRVAMAKIMRELADCATLFSVQSYNMTMTAMALEENQKILSDLLK